MKMLCQICHLEKRENEATRVCKICEELLCDDCAKQHTRQMAKGGGEMHLCADFENLKLDQKVYIQE